MRKLTAVILLWAWAGLASAAMVVPAGKAAVVEVVRGTVSVTTAQGSQAPTVGQALDFGVRVVTGGDGRVFLRLADRAVTRLAANTEMTLDPPGQRHGTFMTLAKGFIRFLVGQRAPGDAFEVSAKNVVAAVKGTDAGVEIVGDTVQGTVYDSDHKPALALTDTDSGDQHDLDPGQTGILGPDGFSQHDLTGQDLQHGTDAFQGLPAADLGQGGADGGQESGPGLGLGQGGSGDTLSQDVQDALDGLGHDLTVEGNQDAQDRNGDLVSGRLAVDRFGVQVQIANNLYRTAADTVVLRTSTSRASGPNQGVTDASLTTQWNKPLPDGDWLNVIQWSLNDHANNFNLSTASPAWYRLNSVFTASNPSGDQLALSSYFGAPFLNTSSVWDQASVQDMWATNAAGAKEEIYYDFYSTTGASLGLTADLSALAGPQVGLASHSAGYGAIPSPLAGGVSYNYGLFANATNYTLIQTFHVLNALGQLQGLPQVATSTGPPFGYPVGPQGFMGLNPDVNIETSLDLPGFFSRSIDLMVMPEIFDGMGGVLPLIQTPYCNCG